MSEVSSRPSPYAVLRYPEFRGLVLGLSLSAVAILIQEVVVSYELYQITHNPLTLGIIGISEAIPFISLALFGGHLADRRDKRAIILASTTVMLLGSLILLAGLTGAGRASLTQGQLLALVYFVVALIGFARGFFAPAASSLLPFLVPRELFSSSVAWRSVCWQGGAILGPGLAGFLYAGIGITGTLETVIALLVVAVLAFSRLKSHPVPEAPAPVALLRSLREGIDFVFGSPIILYSISLDLFSVLFGGVVAILPVFAVDVLHIGAEGLGVLRAAPAVGSILTLLVCTHYPPTGRPWRNLLIAVAGFGVATLVFGLSRSFWLSAAALFATGAFDGISVIVRQTITQVMTPDHMRGRVSSVNSVFISASNELGAFESGVAASLLGAVPSVLAGGVLTLAIVGWVWRRSRALFAVRLA